MSTKRIKAILGFIDGPKVPMASDFIVYQTAIPPSITPVAVLDLSDRDQLIRQAAVAIADTLSPEGHDPEEWSQMCIAGEAVLLSLGLLSGKAGKGKL
jgi:hypothetical protein